MLTIVLDSSNTSLLVGLIKDERIIDSCFYECWQMQSEYMMPELEKLLKKNNFKRDDIESVIVCIGPGSYTGVRIAVTIAKVIGIALNCKVYEVSSLRALGNYNKYSVCVINARSDRSFFGVYFKDKIIVEDCIKTNIDVLKYLDEHPDYVLCGDAKYLGKHTINENPMNQILLLKPSLKEVDPLFLKPVYMKD